MRLIDADKLKITMAFTDAEWLYDNNGKYLAEVIQFIQDKIDEQPTVEAEPIKHGRWKIIDQDVTGCKKYRCELCGAVIEAYGLDNIRYCGGCGAKKDEEVEE